MYIVYDLENGVIVASTKTPAQAQERAEYFTNLFSYVNGHEFNWRVA